MKKIYYQVVENVLPQVYLLYNSFNNKFILLNNVRYEKYKKEKGESFGAHIPDYITPEFVRQAVSYTHLTLPTTPYV